MHSWRAHPDLNQGPADQQSAALTTELCTQMMKGNNCLWINEKLARLGEGIVLGLVRGVPEHVHEKGHTRI